MSSEIQTMILAAIVGSIFTIIVQIIIGYLQKRKIKKAVNAILSDILLKSIDKMEKEIPMVQRILLTYRPPNLTLGLHQETNSKYLSSFSLADLQSVYKKKFRFLVETMAIIDYVSPRTPLVYFDNWNKFIYEHIDTHSEQFKEKWSTDELHFENCPSIKSKQKIYQSNLNNLQKALDELKVKIKVLTK